MAPGAPGATGTSGAPGASGASGAQAVPGAQPSPGAPAGPGEEPREQLLAGFAKGGAWDTAAPGPELAAAVAAAAGPDWRCRGASGEQQIGILGRLAALESWTAAGKLGVIRALIRDDDPAFLRGARHGDLPDVWEDALAHEVALALAASAPSAGKTMRAAWELGARLPEIGALLQNGVIDAPKARLIAEIFTELTDEDAGRAEAQLAAELAEPPAKTYAQVERIATAIALDADPGLGERRRKAAEKHNARVQMFRERSGAAALSGRDLATDQTLAAHANVSARAAQYKDSGAFPLAQLDQLRAAAYLDLLNAIPAHQRIAHGLLTAQAPAETGPTPDPDANRDPDTGAGPPRPGGDDCPCAECDGRCAPDDDTHPDDDEPGEEPGDDGPDGDGPGTGSLGPGSDGGPDGGGADGEDPHGDPGDDAHDGDPDDDGHHGDPDDDGHHGDPSHDGHHGEPSHDGHHGDPGNDGHDGNNPGGSEPGPGGDGGRGSGGDPGDHNHGGLNPGQDSPGNGGDSGPDSYEPPSEAEPPHGGHGTDGNASADGGPAGSPAPPSPSPTPSPFLSSSPSLSPSPPPPRPSAGATPPALQDLVIPLATLLGLADRPGEGHGLGPLDPDLCRTLAATAAHSPRTTICLTITDNDGIAIGHGCGRTRRAAGRPADGPAPPYLRPDPPLVALPARINLTITADRLAQLLPASTGAPGGPAPPDSHTPSDWALSPPDAPGTRAAPRPPSGDPHWCATWTLTLPGGRQLAVPLEPVPTYHCDHRHESHAYQPNDKLRHLVQVRDHVCTFPTCNRHARESDFEHSVPYDKGGRTCACNAGARSRKCHRVKQAPGWAVTQPRPGWHQWSTPRGRTYTQGPKRYPV